MNPGLYFEISPDDYHRDPCETPALSASIAKIIVEHSPAHAWLAHPKLGGQQSHSKEMDHGTLMHALLLGQDRKLVIVDEKDWRKDDAKAKRDYAWQHGATPVLRHRLDEAVVAKDAIRKRLRAEFGISLEAGAGSHSEAVAIWYERADDGTQVLCRGQMDHLKLRAREASIFDLKCGASAAPAACERQISAMGYDVQSTAYTSAIATLIPDLAGRIDFTFLFTECDAPHAVTPMRLDGTLRELGHRRWRRAINTWARCLRDDDWPTYTRSVLTAEGRSWDLEKEDRHDAAE